MIAVRTQITEMKDVAGGFERGLRRGLLDVGQSGFNASQDKVANEATDTGNLLRSGFGPEVDENTLEILWGYAAPYARYVNDGTAPHFPPIAPLKKWARRVLGDASLAWAIAQKIAQEGTDPVRFVEEGVAVMKARLASVGLKAYIEEEL